MQNDLYNGRGKKYLCVIILLRVVLYVSRNYMIKIDNATRQKHSR